MKAKIMKKSILLFRSVFTLVGALGLSLLNGCGCGCNTVIPKIINQSESLGSLRNLNIALLMYSTDYDEIFPNAPTKEVVKTLIFPYTKNEDVFVDLNTNIPFEWNSFLSGKNRTSMDFLPFATFYVAVPSIPDSRPVVTFNGTAKLLTETDWTKLKAISHIP